MENERRGGEGFFRSCFRVLREPGAFFSRPSTKRSRVRPLAFAVRVAALTLPLSWFAEGLLLGEPGAAALGRGLAVLIVSPLIALASLYVTAATTHLWLRVVRGRPLPFRETRECVAYASAATIATVVPVVGPLVAIVWHVVVLIIGLQRTHGSPRGRTAFAVIAGLASPVVLAVTLALTVRSSLVEAYKIPAGSMVPTLEVGDHIFVNKLAYGPRAPLTEARVWQRPARRGEVAVFRYPEKRDQDFIKRVIALPGDRLEVKDGHPIINGWAVPSCPVCSFTYREADSPTPRRAELVVEYLDDKTYLTMYEPAFAASAGEVQGPYFVKPGEVWVLGDNRHNSHDSRSWFGGRGGGVPHADLKGRATFVWLHVDPKGGGPSWGRLFVDVNGAPVLPPAQESLRPAFDRCLKNRPPVSETTPPPPLGPPG